MADTSATKSETTPISTFALNTLPTDFAQPAYCSGVYRDDGILKIDNQRDCLPNGFATEQSIFYSPGIQCPTGYTAQPSCSRSKHFESITTVTCCPVRGDITMSCVDDDATLSPPWTSQFCTWKAGPKTVVLATVTADDGGVNTQAETLQGAGGINAFGIRMVYRQTDFDEAAQETGGSENPASTPDVDGSSGQDRGGDRGGMSQSAKIAVGVTVPVVALLLAGAAFMLWRRTKKARKKSPEEEVSDSIVEHANTQAAKAAKALLSENPKTPTVMAELSSTLRPAELPAESPAR
jgi:hypothetical protein